jgi:membrane protease YdiL (CAAX protease family)
MPTTGFPIAVVVEGGLGLLAIVLAWIIGVPLREQFPSEWSVAAGRIGVGAAGTVPLIVLLWAMVRSGWPIFRRLIEPARWLIDELFPSAHWSEFALIALLAGVGEEVLFRGVLQNVLVRWTGPAIGLILASFVFGLFHAVSRTYFLWATLIGSYFGALAMYFGDLVAPVIAHALYDFTALMYLARLPSRSRAD